VELDSDLAYLAGLAYGDGYALYGEIRVTTGSDEFRSSIESLFSELARKHSATWRSSLRPSLISKRGVWHISINSTTLRRALFKDDYTFSYEAIHTIAVESEFAAEFQAGLTDAEGSLLLPVPIETPHGRVFAMVNNDRRLLGIARVSLVYALHLEPSSVRTRLSKHRGTEHTLNSQRIVARHNSYLIEILSGAKRKWLLSVGSCLRHPAKRRIAVQLLETYRNERV